MQHLRIKTGAEVALGAVVAACAATRTDKSRTFDETPSIVTRPRVSVSAVVTAHKRFEQTLVTVRRLTECQPEPAEILVHVDGNEAELARAVQLSCPGVRVILSQANVGPGGGRNKLLAAA